MAVMQIVAESTDLSRAITAVLVFEIMCFCRFRDREALKIGGQKAARHVCRTVRPANTVVSLLYRSLASVKGLRWTEFGCRLLNSSAFWGVQGFKAGMTEIREKGDFSYLDDVLIMNKFGDIISDQSDQVDEAVLCDIWTIAI